jgi:hypothetical protein
MAPVRQFMVPSPHLIIILYRWSSPCLNPAGGRPSGSPDVRSRCRSLARRRPEPHAPALGHSRSVLVSLFFRSVAVARISPLARARGARGNAGIHSHSRMDDGRNNHNRFRSHYALALDLDAGFARNLASRHGLRDFAASHGTSTGDSSVARHIHRHGGGSGGRIAGIYLSIPLVATVRVVWRRLPALRNTAVS